MTLAIETTGSAAEVPASSTEHRDAPVADDARERPEAAARSELDNGRAVIVARFEDVTAASTARKELGAAAERRQVSIQRLVTVTADEAGKIHIQELSGDSVWPGVKYGLVAAFVAALFLVRPLFAVAVAFGTAGGALGMIRSAVLKARLGWSLLGLVRPNEAGVVAIVRGSDVGSAKNAMRHATSVEATDIHEVGSRHFPRVARRGT